jgi:hypothetical protein
MVYRADHTLREPTAAELEGLSPKGFTRLGIRRDENQKFAFELGKGLLSPSSKFC